MRSLWLSSCSAMSSMSQQMTALGPQQLAHQGLEVCVYAYNEGCNDSRALWQQHPCLLSCSLSCGRGLDGGQFLLSLLQDWQALMVHLLANWRCLIHQWSWAGA